LAENTADGSCGLNQTVSLKVIVGYRKFQPG
jgi:hypothetical protein